MKRYANGFPRDVLLSRKIRKGLTFEVYLIPQGTHPSRVKNGWAYVKIVRKGDIILAHSRQQRFSY